MALIPQERPKQIALVVGIAALALLYVFHAYWYTPKIVEIEELQLRFDDLETKNRQAQIVAARAGVDLEERLAVYERHMGRLEELIPNQEEVSSLLNSISMAAGREGVEIYSLDPGPVQTESFYTRHTFNMSVWGEYHSVGRFLASVATLPRIVTPQELSLTPYTEEGRSGVVAPVMATFYIETYVLPTAPGDLPAMLGDDSPSGGEGGV